MCMSCTRFEPLRRGTIHEGAENERYSTGQGAAICARRPMQGDLKAHLEGWGVRGVQADLYDGPSVVRPGAGKVQRAIGDPRAAEQYDASAKKCGTISIATLEGEEQFFDVPTAR